MSFKNTILYSCDTLTIEKAYDALHLKKRKHLVASRNHRDGLIIHDVRSRGKTKSNIKFCNYYKKKGHLVNECYKLQNKLKSIANKQSETIFEKSDRTGRFNR